MSSRLRDRTSFKTLFLTYFKTEIQNQNDNTRETQTNDNGTSPAPVITYYYPPHSDPEVLNTALQFIPRHDDNEQGTNDYSTTTLVDLFTFVLTSSTSHFTFGYSRHSGRTTTVLITFLPWQELFYRALNYIAELHSESEITSFLHQFHCTLIPDPGTCLYVQSLSVNVKKKAFIVAVPGDYGLPSIPENRSVSEYYNALSPPSQISLFTSALSERRILITSKRLSRLTSICLALNSFLYPMTWQHIFIPLLPPSLIDYLSAPMPFIIGCPKWIYDKLDWGSIGSVVIVDGDTDTVVDPFGDSLPDDVVAMMKKGLKGERVLGDGLARGHLRAIAMMIGHYEECFVKDGSIDEKATFDEGVFISLAHPAHRSFISSKLLKLQIFQQFIEEKEKIVNAGISISDEFEFEAMAWRSHNRGGNYNQFKKQFNEQNFALKKASKSVISNLKSHSGHLIETVKGNSALKSAVQKVQKTTNSVKHKTTTSYSGFKSKFYSGDDESKNLKSIKSSQYKNKLSINLPHSNILNSSSSATELGSRSSRQDTTSTHEFSSQASSQNSSPMPTPRLSKSEENLIDLESPTEINNSNASVDVESVFEDLGLGDSDEKFLEAYGLNSYFENKGNFSKSSGQWVCFD